MKRMNRLTSLTLRGFKTIKELDDFRLGPLNVLIGANGSGKSNFVSFFRMLSAMMASPGDLQFHVGKVGGANSLLHDGATVTRLIEAQLRFDTDPTICEYAFTLHHSAADTLIFVDE